MISIGAFLVVYCVNWTT